MPCGVRDCALTHSSMLGAGLSLTKPGKHSPQNPSNDPLYLLRSLQSSIKEEGVGLAVVGLVVGRGVGGVVGALEKTFSVGIPEGLSVGFAVGLSVGLSVGFAVGVLEGFTVGRSVGLGVIVMGVLQPLGHIYPSGHARHKLGSTTPLFGLYLPAVHSTQEVRPGSPP